MNSLRTSEPIITLAITISDNDSTVYETRTVSLTPGNSPQIAMTELARSADGCELVPEELYITVDLLGLHVEPDVLAGDSVPAVIGDSLTPPHHHHPDGTVCREQQCPGPHHAYLYVDLAGEVRVLTHRMTAHRAAEAAQSIVAVLPLDGDYRTVATRTRDVARGLFDAIDRPDALPAAPAVLVDDVMTHAIAAVPDGRDRVLAMLSADAYDPEGDKAFAQTEGMSGLTPTPVAEAISGAEYGEDSAA